MLSVVRTLRLTARSESCAWLNAPAVEVNRVFNCCNEISCAATRTDLKRSWLSGLDLCCLAIACRAMPLRV